MPASRRRSIALGELRPRDARCVAAAFAPDEPCHLTSGRRVEARIDGKDDDDAKAPRCASTWRQPAPGVGPRRYPGLTPPPVPLHQPRDPPDDPGQELLHLAL